MSGEWGRSGENMGLGQIEEKLNEGLSHGWKGEKCSGGWGQTRKNGEAELPGQDLGKGWGDAAKGFAEQRIPKSGLTAKGDVILTLPDLKEHTSP